MQFDIVIATRNRLSALQMSLPLFVQQTRKPNRVIVVDSSDDSSAVSELAAKAFHGSPVSYLVINSEIRSSAYQRNRGLQEVTSPIVMMPDDDSLWFTDTAAEIMRVYEDDRNELIGGVTAKSVQRSPTDTNDLEYTPNRIALIKSFAQPWRSAFEKRFLPQPFLVYADEVAHSLPAPDWVGGERSRRVATVGGFRMSFRTNSIRNALFDEVLGYRSGYCQHEDMDSSLRIQANGQILVSAEHARVFHHVFPGKRAGGFDYGFGQIANYLYICCKVIPRQSTAWKHLSRYVNYKIFLYGLSKDEYFRDVQAGARYAWSAHKRLMSTSSEDLAQAFYELCDGASVVQRSKSN